MSSAAKEQYKGIFTYTDEVLRDFEAMYLEKSAVSPKTRILLGLIGLLGVGVFAALMVLQGFSVGFLIPALLFGLLILLALLMGRKRADGSVTRYRKHYLEKRAHVLLDERGVELKLNGQKSYARSKYADVYSLLETDKTFFLEIKGRAFYILPKDGLDGNPDEIREFLQKKCRKHFLHYDVSGTEGND